MVSLRTLCVAAVASSALAMPHKRGNSHCGMSLQEGSPSAGHGHPEGAEYAHPRDHDESKSSPSGQSSINPDGLPVEEASSPMSSKEGKEYDEHLNTQPSEEEEKGEKEEDEESSASQPEGYEESSASQPEGDEKSSAPQPEGYEESSASQSEGDEKASAPQPEGYEESSASQPEGNEKSSTPQPEGYEESSASQPEGDEKSSAPQPEGYEESSASQPEGDEEYSAPQPEGDEKSAAPQSEGDEGSSSPQPEGDEEEDSSPSPKRKETQPKPTSFAPGAGFQIVLANPPVVPLGGEFQPNVAVWDVDMFEIGRNKSVIQALHSHGKFVICYFNAGAVQSQDGDIADWPMDDSSVVGKDLSFGPAGDEFTGETWVNVKSTRTRDLMAKRVAMAAAMGCDAIDPDNVDGWYAETGFGLTQEDYRDYLLFLSDAAHSNGLKIGLKNSPENAPALVDAMDFAVLENCLWYGDSSSSFCREYQRFIEKGKPVFDVEYPRSAYKGSKGCSPEEYAMFCEADPAKWKNAGFSEILKLDGDTHGLDGWTQYCDNQPAFDLKLQ